MNRDNLQNFHLFKIEGEIPDWEKKEVVIDSENVFGKLTSYSCTMVRDGSIIGVHSPEVSISPGTVKGVVNSSSQLDFSVRTFSLNYEVIWEFAREAEEFHSGRYLNSEGNEVEVDEPLTEPARNPPTFIEVEFEGHHMIYSNFRGHVIGVPSQDMDVCFALFTRFLGDSVLNQNY